MFWLNIQHVCAQVSTLVSSLQPLVYRVAELEGRLTRSLSVAKQGLDILADQLVALGALNGRSSPTKNPLAGVCAPVTAGLHHCCCCSCCLTAAGVTSVLGCWVECIGGATGWWLLQPLLGCHHVVPRCGGCLLLWRVCHAYQLHTVTKHRMHFNQG
jgi:hypothetical protein